MHMCWMCSKTPKHNGDTLCRKCRESTSAAQARARARRPSRFRDAVLVVTWRGVVLKQVYRGPVVQIRMNPDRLPQSVKGQGGRWLPVMDLNKFQPSLDFDTVKRYKAVFMAHGA